MKKFFILILCLFTSTIFAAEKLSNLDAAAKFASCGDALATNNKSFCHGDPRSFDVIAKCNCLAMGQVNAVCSDMKLLYNAMIASFSRYPDPLHAACQYAHDTQGADIQECKDDWNCYRLGGKDSKNRLCSGTGKKCPPQNSSFTL